MQVDISTLSAKELYELAKKREQEEALRTAQLEQLETLNKQRSQLEQEYDATLEKINQEIEALHHKRILLVREHEKSLSTIKKDIQELNNKLDKAPAVKLETKAESVQVTCTDPATSVIDKTPLAPTQRKPQKPNDDIGDKIIGLLKMRTDISNSLLKEKLKAEGYDVSNLGKKLDQLVREKKITSKGGGNYSIARR